MNNRLSFLHLEVLQQCPRESHRPTPLLFVHGAYVGAWCWDEYFLPYFADRGYNAYALSLSGHGGSNGRDRLNWLSLRDYVADLEQVVATMPYPPVLIGHSMGGLVIQKYLEKHAVPAVVLMASVPPTGLLEMNWWIGMTRPQLLHELLLVQAGAAHYTDYREVRNALFSPRLPDHQAQRYLSHTQPESQRALWDMNGWDLPVALHKRPPALVLGAGADLLVPRFSVQATASAFATDPEWFEDMAHVMMLDPEWEQAAARIHDWLLERDL